MTDYVVGFLFNYDQEVLLIKKTKPEWQKGKLNGVGGKIEPGEKPIEAMIREFKEEAGIDILAWTHFATLKGKDYKIYFFKAFDLGVNGSPKSVTEEEVAWYNVNTLPKNVVPNLLWMIPIAYRMRADYRAEFINRTLTAEQGQL